MFTFLARARDLVRDLMDWGTPDPYPIPDCDEAALWHRSGAESPFRQEYDLNENSLVFDVGGYEGQWAADIHSRYGCRVHIFEPVPFQAEKIERRFARNPRVTVHAFGLADFSGRRRIGLANDQSSVHRLTDAVVEAEFRDAATFLRDGHFSHIDLMKINIEGGEFQLVPHLVQEGWIDTIANLQIQFHSWCDRATERRDKIRLDLAATHRQTYCFPFVWENWARLPDCPGPVTGVRRPSPLVSVIIPTYNRAATLPNALRSVLEQVDVECEVIVADDGSTDTTSQVVSVWAPKFNGRLRYIGLTHVGRCGTPRNVALRAASGEYVAFLDSDDEWLPEKIAAQLAVLEGDRRVGMVSTNAVVKRPNIKEPPTLYFPASTTAMTWGIADCVDANPVILSTAIVRRDLLLRAGGFPNDIRLLGLEDYTLWLKLMLLAECRYLPQASTVYLDDPLGSVRGHWAMSDYMNGLLLALEQLEDFAHAQGLWTAQLQASLLQRRRRLALDRFLHLLKERRLACATVTACQDMLRRRPRIWRNRPRHLNHPRPS